MRREGDAWTIQFAGQTARVRRLKGFDDLARLLAQPHRPISATELAGAHVIQPGTGPVLDGEARRSYRERLDELEREIARAQLDDDPGRADSHERERAALAAELSAAIGLAGRERTSASSSERSRNSVTFRIRSAIRLLEQVHPPLAEHLHDTIRTGHTCAYVPPQEVRWEIAQ